ncbi:cytidine deaminase-like protein [Gigaspora rosea]|uniref:Cytidine deaminase-like protein n=1 Tax=Gigaspora rosea TaxID=44941 RepID=A0A397V2B3_9GLOM|nr:cytidine deaminase-like protein [Gigaspora rosea]
MEDESAIILPFRKVPSDEEERGLETVDVYISDVEPAETGRVLKFVQIHCPQAESLDRVKRIRKVTHDQGFTLNVLICLTSSITLDNLKLLIKQHDLESILSLRIHQISKYPPVTRVQFEEWNRLWPINFREDPRRDSRFSSEEIELLRNHMIRAIKLADIARSKGEVPVGCVIVDPEKAEIMCESHDTRTSSNHPLKHAVLNCINQVAMFEKTKLNSINDSLTPKKRKADKSDDQLAFSSDTLPELNILENKENSAGVYLCKGYDIFVTHEPCITCSMALVHSRIGRVFYGRSNNASGGLGSYYKIHTHHALNHHFKTFNGFLEDQIEMLMIDC